MRLLLCIIVCSISLTYTTSSYAIPLNPPLALSPWQLLPSIKTWIDIYSEGDFTPQVPKPWLMPHRASWEVLDGVPQVSTPRLDELWLTIVHRRQLDPRWWSSRLKTPRKALQALNPEVDFDALVLGQRIKAWTHTPGSISQSIWRANRGRMTFGEPLPPALNYRIMFPHRAFGTYYTISAIQQMMQHDVYTYPAAQPLVIGDLSYRTGRRIRPHMSHRSGRDVDISYPRLDHALTLRKFTRPRRDQVDGVRLLSMIRTLIKGGHTEFVLMDRWVQRAAYDAAVEQGAPQAWLEAVFQYPKWSGQTLVRRSKGHDDHMHIRFFCQDTDKRCR